MEAWKPIKGYEGLYEVSNHGRVKSLRSKGKFLRAGISSGYYVVGLCNNGERRTRRIHTLVWDSFGDKLRNGRKLQVDHINGVKTDNRIDNLQLLTARQNATKYYSAQNSTSKYVGVYYSKYKDRWRSIMKINGKLKHLGYFKNEYDAHLAYQNKLNEIGDPNEDDK